ncbi:hypothetical protein [Synechococcus sp. CS-1332]|uniref:hypothetical protein n=1 Tax=Synechococcus sp. CS-1332 TaxID=2847972 RepID=UPI00223B8486|nr:hypothetical protein [Synechococcus sp. CS-1332]MCT0207714.1 hypothetical protein [Synechococcus sp. CS-1332]
MISRSSRLFHAALVVVCGAGIVYTPVQAQTSLTLQLGQPGYFGPINLGNQTPPPVYGYGPVIVRPDSRGRDRWTQAATQPVYLRVPMNQARDWGRYCGLYQACNMPVQFVRDDWYRNVYAPRVRAAQARQAKEARDRWRAFQRNDNRVLLAPPGRAYGLEKHRGWDDDDD